MTKKDNEDERLERTIRGLLKLPENRRCLNCNSLGPQYVCTTFWTFLCTNCSGVHREFMHRVKSVSMAKFNAEEVSALQAGGNERARQIYFKEWDEHRHSFPDSSNFNRLREFVKSVYVDRKYTGERIQERSSRMRPVSLPKILSLESFDARNLGAFRSGSQSPNYEDRHGKHERTLEYYFEERNSPRPEKESLRQGGLRRQTPRFEVVDDRFRDDDSRSSRVFDISRLSHRESGQGSRSLDPKSNNAQPELPAVRPLKQILGEKFIPLQVGEESKATRPKGVNVSTPAEPKNKPPENSIIEFNTKSNPVGGASVVQPENKKSSGGNIPSEPLTPPSPHRNTVEFLMIELTAPFVAPVGVQTTKSADSEQSNGAPLSAPPGQMLALTNGFDASEQAARTDNPSPTRQMSAMTDDSRTYTILHGTQMLPNSALSAPDGQSVPDTSVNSSMFSTGKPPVAPVKNTSLDSFDSPSSSSVNNFFTQNPDAHFQAVPLSGSASQVSGHQPSDFSAAYRISEGQHSATRYGAQEKKPSTSLNDHNVQGISSAQVGQSPKEDSKAAQGAAVKPQTETLGRKELPQDLFASYLPASRPVPGWPTGPSYATTGPSYATTGPSYAAGFGMQYHPTSMPGLAYASQPRSSNPFDFSNEPTPPQVSQFPSTDSFPGALPDPVALGMVFPITGGNIVSSRLMRPQAASAMLPQSTAYSSSFASGGYTGQLPYVNMPHSRPQGPGGFAGDAAPSFNSFNMSHSGYSPQGPANGGNPFG